MDRSGIRCATQKQVLLPTSLRLSQSLSDLFSQPLSLHLCRRLQSFEGFFGAAQGLLHVVADILGANQFLEFGLLDQAQGLLSARKESRRARFSAGNAAHFLQGKESGGIERRHVAQAENHDRRQLVQMLGDDIDLVGRAERNGP